MGTRCGLSGGCLIIISKGKRKDSLPVPASHCCLFLLGTPPLAAHVRPTGTMLRGALAAAHRASGPCPATFIRHFSGDGAKRTRGPRNTKNYDWYYKAVEKLANKERVPLPVECFPKAVGARSKAFLELEQNGEALGRLVFVLCEDILPRTCDNFKLLCKGTEEFKYEGTLIHRIARNQVIMGGDVEMLEGKGGHSALGTKYFKDEALVGLHNAPGILSMVNGGVDTNNSQFFITIAPQRQLNGRNVAFGYLESGAEVLDKVASTFTFQQHPLTKIVVSKAGIL